MTSEWTNWVALNQSYTKLLVTKHIFVLIAILCMPPLSLTLPIWRSIAWLNDSNYKDDHWLNVLSVIHSTSSFGVFFFISQSRPYIRCILFYFMIILMYQEKKMALSLSLLPSINQGHIYKRCLLFNLYMYDNNISRKKLYYHYIISLSIHHLSLIFNPRHSLI